MCKMLGAPSESNQKKSEAENLGLYFKIFLSIVILAFLQ